MLELQVLIHSRTRSLPSLPLQPEIHWNKTSWNAVGMPHSKLWHASCADGLHCRTWCLQAAGKIKALGTSNFEVHHLQQLIDTGSPPAVNQVLFHVGYVSAQLSLSFAAFSRCCLFSLPFVC